MKMISGKAESDKHRKFHIPVLFACSLLICTALCGKRVYGAGFTCSDYFYKLVVTDYATDYVTPGEVTDDYSLTITKDGQTLGVINGSDITKKGSSITIGRIRHEDISSGIFPDLSTGKDHGIIKNLNYDSDLIDKRIRELEFISVLPDHPELVVMIALNMDGLYELEDNHDTK